MVEESNILKYDIETEQILYLAYMPFVDQGGLFIRTEQKFSLGDSVEVYLSLPDDGEPVTFTSCIIWVNPGIAVNNQIPGVGVQLQGEVGEAVKKRIEGLLSDRLISTDPTDTV